MIVDGAAVRGAVLGNLVKFVMRGSMKSSSRCAHEFLKMRPRACGREFSAAVALLTEKIVFGSERIKEFVSLRFRS